MQNIQKEYSILFNAITDTEAELLRLHIKLIEAQQMAEEIYISEPDSGTGTNGELRVLQ